MNHTLTFKFKPLSHIALFQEIFAAIFHMQNLPQSHVIYISGSTQPILCTCPNHIQQSIQTFKFFIVHISSIPFCYLTQVKTALTANIKYLSSKLFCCLRHEVSYKKQMTSLKQRPPYKGKRSSISWEISSIVWNIDVQNCVWKSPQLLPVLSQYKTNYEFIIVFMKTQYSELQSSKYSFRYLFFV
jgi:hypothetical protein